MPADARAIIEGLRDEIRRIERKPPRRACFASSGRTEVDGLLPGGGFPRGALTELSGGRASGKTCLALSALASAMGVGGLAAFVDGRGELYPPAAAALGVDLERLLIVRPPGRERHAAEDHVQALWAAEALLASGAFEAIAIDVPIGVAVGGARLAAMLRRLCAAAEKGGAVGIWLGSPGGVRVPSSIRLEVAAGLPGPRIRRAIGRGAQDAPPVRSGGRHAAA